MTKEWIGWHFLKEDKRLRWDSKEVVEVGKTLTTNEEPELCKVGFHASKKTIDALTYAPGAIACKVKLSGAIVEDTDKAAATERTVLAMADATTVLHEFACWCAERALRKAKVKDKRSWNAIKVKRAWLAGKATDEELDAARDAARDAQNKKLEKMLLDLLEQ